MKGRGLPPPRTAPCHPAQVASSSWSQPSPRASSRTRCTNTQEQTSGKTGSRDEKSHTSPHNSSTAVHFGRRPGRRAVNTSPDRVAAFGCARELHEAVTFLFKTSPPQTCGPSASTEKKALQESLDVTLSLLARQRHRSFHPTEVSHLERAGNATGTVVDFQSPIADTPKPVHVLAYLVYGLILQYSTGPPCLPKPVKAACAHTSSFYRCMAPVVL